MKHTIATAILSLTPGAQFVSSTTYDSIQWHSSDITKPTESEITTKIAELDAGEAKNLLRKDRNQLLTDCDWTRLDDNGIAADKKVEWATYRQQLRDLPATVTAAKSSFGVLGFSPEPSYPFVDSFDL